MNKPLKIGFVGGGLNSAIGQIHFSACQLDGIWKVESGIFSLNDNINKKTGKYWNIPNERVYKNLKNFIKYEKNKLDAVAVIVPIPDHFKIIYQLLKNNIPVISEKTMVSNLNEAKKIFRICKNNNSFLNITYNYTGYPMIRELKAKIKKDELGKLQQIHIEMPQDSYLNLINGKASIQKWRLIDKSIPTFILDLASHIYNLSYFLIEKKPKKIFSNFTNFSKLKVIDDAFMQLQFDGGIQGYFWASKVASGNRNSLKIRIFGTKGSAEWNHFNPEELKISLKNSVYSIYDRKSKSFIAENKRYNRFKAGHPSGFLEAFANLYFDISVALKNYKKSKRYNNPYVFNQNYELESMKVLTKATLSNKKQNWQKINFLKKN